MTDTESRIPDGFELVPEGLGFTDTLQPLYRRVSDDMVSFGLTVRAQHSNSMGFCHGGVLMSLADITAASGVNVARGAIAGAPTISLSVDFIAIARMGQWLQADVNLAEIKRRFGFGSGVMWTEEGTVARFNGTFYLPEHKGMWKGDKREGGALQPVEHSTNE